MPKSNWRTSLGTLGVMASAIVFSCCGRPVAPEPASQPQTQTTSSATDPTPSPNSSPQSARQPSLFDEQVLEIARGYWQFIRVSDRLNWSPLACAMPRASGVQQSSSDDPSTHGRKLYFLFAKDANDYASLRYSHYYRQIGGQPNTEVTPWKAAIGQALVKEAFVPERVPASEEPERLVNDPERRLFPAEYARTADGTFFRTGEPAGLFIMFKLDPSTPGTDEGWVYAATTPDGQTVLDAGRIESCMRCHARAEHDRLFGVR